MQVNRLQERCRKLQESVVRRGFGLDTADCAVTPTAVSLDVLKEMFVYTRLPAPPGRVLVTGGRAALADRLRRQTRSSHVVSAHAEGMRVVPGVAVEPFPAASFDVVVAVDGVATWDAWHDLLAPGGRILGCSQEGCPAINGFEIVEERQAALSHGNWTFNGNPYSEPGVMFWVAMKV